MVWILTLCYLCCVDIIWSFSFCLIPSGWFCGRSPKEDEIPYSEHYSNILSALDFNGKMREETYWLIYQFLSVIYKYLSHSEREKAQGTDKSLNGDLLNGRNVSIAVDEDNASDSESDSDSDSVSMVMTRAKSKYAKLKPPPRRRNGSRQNSRKSKSKSRASFNKISNLNTSGDESGDSQR